MDPSQANVCTGPTHCTYLWETHTSTSCWGSVLMLDQVTTASSVVRDTTSSPLRPEWLTLQEQTEGQMWRISALRLTAGPSGPPWLPDPVPGAALGQECPHPQQRWPQARGWMVLSLQSPTVARLVLLWSSSALSPFSQFLPGLPADTLQGHRDRFMEQFTK